MPSLQISESVTYWQGRALRLRFWLARLRSMHPSLFVFCDFPVLGTLTDSHTLWECVGSCFMTAVHREAEIVVSLRLFKICDEAKAQMRVYIYKLATLYRKVRTRKSR